MEECIQRDSQDQREPIRSGASMWISVVQTITDPPQVLQLAECSPRHLSHSSQVLSDLPLMESVADMQNLGRSLMEVIFSNSGSPQPRSCTKEQMAVLFLGCCPPTATSTSPGVFSTVSTLCWETQQTI